MSGQRQVAAAVVAAVVLLAGCTSSAPTSPTSPSATAPSTTTAPSPITPVPTTAPTVVVLAKVDGWRSDLPANLGMGTSFALLEIADDEAAARQAWQQNVPSGSARRTGPPSDVGTYGDLTSVDLSTHLVAVYSSGESGSCPEWPTEVRLVDDLTVSVRTQALNGPSCTADYRPYRVVLAVDRRALPAPTRPQLARLLRNDSLTPTGIWVSRYPAGT